MNKQQKESFRRLLKWVHSIIFVLNIFPNSHLIQKCIHNQQLFWNSCWFCIYFWIKWELGKILDTKMIEWTQFSSPFYQVAGRKKLCLLLKQIVLIQTLQIFKPSSGPVPNSLDCATSDAKITLNTQKPNKSVAQCNKGKNDSLRILSYLGVNFSCFTEPK